MLVVGHVGAWAPKPEQIATARLLGSPDVIRPYHERVVAGLERRLWALHDGLAAMAWPRLT